MARYQAVYFPEEDDRLAEWCVVDWYRCLTVEKFYGRDGESLASDIALVLNMEEQQEIFAEFG